MSSLGGLQDALADVISGTSPNLGGKSVQATVSTARGVFGELSARQLPLKELGQVAVRFWNGLNESVCSSRFLAPSDHLLARHLAADLFWAAFDGASGSDLEILRILLVSHAFCIELSSKAKEFSTVFPVYERLRTLVVKSCEFPFPFESAQLRAIGSLSTYLWNGADVLGYSMPLELSAQLTRVIQFFPASLVQRSMLLLCAPAADALVTHLRNSASNSEGGEAMMHIQLVKAWVDAVRLAVPDAEVDVSLTRVRALLALVLRFHDEASILAQRAFRTDSSALSLSVLLYVSARSGSNPVQDAAGALEKCDAFLRSSSSFAEKAVVVRALCVALPCPAAYVSTFFASAVASLNSEGSSDNLWAFSHQLTLEHLLDAFSLSLTYTDRPELVLELFEDMKPLIESLVERNSVKAEVATFVCHKLSGLAAECAAKSSFVDAVALWEANVLFAAFLPDTLSKKETARVMRCLALAYLSLSPPNLASADCAISSALSLEPESPHGLFLRIRLNLLKRDDVAAEAALEPLLTSTPPPSAALLAELAQDAYKQGNCAVCVDALKAALPHLRAGGCEAAIAVDILHNLGVVILTDCQWRQSEATFKVLVDAFRLASALSLEESESDWWWSIGWNLTSGSGSAQSGVCTPDVEADVFRILGAEMFAGKSNPPYRQASALFMCVSKAVDDVGSLSDSVVESIVAQLVTLEALAADLGTAFSLNGRASVSSDLCSVVCSPRFPLLVSLLRLVLQPTNSHVLERVTSSAAVTASDLEAVAERLKDPSHTTAKRALLCKALDLLMCDTSGTEDTATAEQCVRVINALLLCAEGSGLEDAPYICRALKQLGARCCRRDVQDIAAFYWNAGVSFASAYMPSSARPWLQVGVDIASTAYPPLEDVEKMRSQLKQCEREEATDPAHAVFGGVDGG